MRSIIPHMAVARRLFENTLVVGAGLRGALLNMYTKEASQGLFTYSGVSGEFGGVWQPRALNFRMALAAPGWVRLRAGTYWEPSRYEMIKGRMHGTAGGEFRLARFQLKKNEYRIALSLAGDFASRFQNVGASIGLWN